MSPTIMMWLYVVFLLASLQLVSSNVCPKNCLCDVERGFNRASCTHQNIINVGVGVSEDVEIYDLNSNSIHQLEDYCFKDLGYTSLIEINLSNNLIFWIGLHALADVENLEVLDLSNNRLQAFAVDLFWYNKKLKYLNLSGNKFLGFHNKPFLSHNNLEVLNLSKSQISFLPELVFSQLPKLKSLDLSKNSMIELQLSVLRPLTHLSYLSLAENNWHCNGMFSDLQVWILQKKIEYVTQCKQKEKPKMFEKIISLVTTEDSVRNVDKKVNIETLWKIKKKDRDDIPTEPTINTSPSFIENFNSKFPSLWSLIIGLIVGVLVGMVVTYCWMAELLKCRKIRWKSRRQMRRERAVEHTEVHPLWTTNMRIQANTETPPTARRERPTSNAFCRSESWEGTSFRTEPIAPPRYASRTQSTGTPVTISGSDSPPPPYREYFHDRVINSIPEQ